MVLSSLLSAGVVGDGDSDGDDSVALLTVPSLSSLLSLLSLSSVRVVADGDGDGGDVVVFGSCRC